MLAALALAADQFVKYLTIEYLPYGEPVPVLGEFLQWKHVTNPGAAFSLGADVTWLFTIVLSVVAGVIVWKAFGLRSRRWAVVLGLLLGGVLGNLTDRLFRAPGFAVGEVVDTIWMPWLMPAIFNVADVFVVTAMTSLALLIVFGVRTDGGRQRDDLVEADTSDAGASDAGASDTGASDTGASDTGASDAAAKDSDAGASADATAGVAAAAPKA